MSILFPLFAAVDSNIIVAVISVAGAIAGVWAKGIFDHRIARQEQQLKTNTYWRDEVPMLREELDTTKADLKKAVEKLTEMVSRQEKQDDLISSLYRRIGVLSEDNRILRRQLRLTTKDLSNGDEDVDDESRDRTHDD
jgi:predicted  nucleic acid-binding Zn-ribbon protein